MKSILTLLFLSLLGAPPEPLPSSLPKEIQIKVEDSAKRFLSQECSFLVQSYDPRDPNKTQLAFCVYTETKSQGIFKESVCVGTLMEPISLVKNPFYGSHGHWGAAGVCEGKKMKGKLEDPKETRMTPVKSFQFKRKEGMKLRLLKDEMDLWDTFNKLTDPKRK